MNVNEKFLLDTFSVTGNDIVDFKDAVNEMSKRTHFVRCNSDEVMLLSYMAEKDEYIAAYVINPLSMPSLTPSVPIINTVKGIRKDQLLERGDFNDQIKEVEENSKLFFLRDKTLFFTSSNVYSTLDSIGMKGSFLSTPSYELHQIMAKQFATVKKDCTLVVKEVNNVQKCFALLSGRYQPLYQNVLFEIVDKVFSDKTMGKTACYGWGVSHFFTKINIEFPEKAAEFKALYSLTDDFVPGVEIMTSDTGDCSVTVRSTWRLKGHVMPGKEIRKKHSGKIEINDLMKEVENTIYAEYTKFPEALCELMATDITDATLDLAKKKDANKNHKVVCSAIKSVFKQLEMTKTVGKKLRLALFNELCAEIDPTIAYTAYDIAMMVVEMPERAIVSASVKARLEKVCGKAIFAEYTTSDSEDDDDVAILS